MRRTDTTELTVPARSPRPRARAGDTRWTTPASRAWRSSRPALTDTAPRAMAARRRRDAPPASGMRARWGPSDAGEQRRGAAIDHRRRGVQAEPGAGRSTATHDPAGATRLPATSVTAPTVRTYAFPLTRSTEGRYDPALGAVTVNVPGTSAPSGVWTTSPSCVQVAGSMGSVNVTVIVGRGPTRSSVMAGSTTATPGRSVSSTMIAGTGVEAIPAPFSTLAQSVFGPSPAGNVQAVTAWYAVHGSHAVPSPLKVIRAGPERLPAPVRVTETVVLSVRPRPSLSTMLATGGLVPDHLDHQRIGPHGRGRRVQIDVEPPPERRRVGEGFRAGRAGGPRHHALVGDDGRRGRIEDIQVEVRAGRAGQAGKDHAAGPDVQRVDNVIDAPAQPSHDNTGRQGYAGDVRRAVGDGDCWRRGDRG